MGWPLAVFVALLVVVGVGYLLEERATRRGPYGRDRGRGE